MSLPASTEKEKRTLCAKWRGAACVLNGRAAVVATVEYEPFAAIRAVDPCPHCKSNTGADFCWETVNLIMERDGVFRS